MQHCETTALGVLLSHQGVELSEPMRFGLGSGLGFLYWDARNLGFPFLGGRVRPFELTRNLTSRLGLGLEVSETSSPRRAWQHVAAHLDAGRPVGLQLDCFHLEYFTSTVHFGGHVVAIYRYDARRAYLVDTEQQGGTVSTSLRSLAAARAERGPLTARHRSFTIDVPPGALTRDGAVPRERLVAAITSCAAAFLEPPIANLGYRGIEKAARQVPAWLRRSAHPERDLAQAAMLLERGGTGGALFRNLYRDFLQECTEQIDDADLRTGHAHYARAAELWTEVAALIGTAGETAQQAPLVTAGSVLRELARLEHDAMCALRRIGP